MTSPGRDLWASWDCARFEELAQAEGTPFFVYDADWMNDRIDAIRRAFEGCADIFYAVKANPNLGVLHAIREGVDGLDVSSAGEIEQAFKAGFDPGRLSFAGPGKSDDELAFAIDRSIGCISVESVRELETCAAIAGAQGRKARCAIRVNPLAAHRSFGLKMGGRAVQFGVDEEDLGQAIEVATSLGRDIEFQGIHVYVGSQCFEPDGIVHSVEDALRIAGDIEARSSLACSVVNLGGGFGVGHGVIDKELDLAQLAAALTPILRRFREGSRAPRKLIFELGRYITTAAGIYVSRVVSSKESRDKRFFVVDGGLHHHLAAAGTFGAALRSNYALRNLTRPTASPVRCNVAGPSCNPTDLLAIDIDLPRPERGDLIGVLMAGGYGFTASPILFLGRRTAAEWVVHRGKVRIARRPHAMTEFN